MRGFIREYVSFIFTNWWSRLSGGLSIPFALISAFTTGGERVLFVILAFLSLLVSVGFLIARILELKEKLRPKLKVSCGPNVDGCHVVTSIGIAPHQKVALYLRVMVEVDGVGDLEDCTGTLIRIEKGAAAKLGHERLGLTFAAGVEAAATSRRLRNKVPDFLDILMITEDREIVPCTSGFVCPRSIDLREIFSERGIYILTLILNGKDSPSQEIPLQFHWGGNYAEAALIYEPPAPV
jgi:hypothetical protein